MNEKKTPLQASFVSCGKEHFSALNIKNQTPYAWGCNLNSRCGIDFEDPDLELGDS